jgi:hypothetical protein
MRDGHGSLYAKVYTGNRDRVLSNSVQGGSLSIAIQGSLYYAHLH